MSKPYYYFKQILFFMLLTAYVLLLAQSLLFKQVSPLEIFRTDRIISRSLNLTPFKTVFNYIYNPNINMWIMLLNVAGNIVLFIPLGLYLQIYMKNKKILSSVAVACIFSICVELTQYIFGIGYADIDDVILNTLGGLLGVLLYKFIYMLLKDESKTKTAVTYLFCAVCACFGACYIILRYVLGYAIRIL